MKEIKEREMGKIIHNIISWFYKVDDYIKTGYPWVRCRLNTLCKLF